MITEMGAYVAIEGGDGSGKSTVAVALKERLEKRGEEVIVVREPGSTELGERIREILLNGPDMTPWAEAFLFAAQRAQLSAEVLKPALDDGKWVISDRSYYSSIAYQGGARGLGADLVRTVNEAGLGGVVPTLVVILDTETDVALGRQHDPDRIGSEEVEFHAAVRKAYLALAEHDSERVVVIDGSFPIEDIVDRIMERL